MTTRRVVVRQAGGSLTVTLPKELTDRYQLAAGDELSVIETEQGILFTQRDEAFERAMAAYQRLAKKYANALRELASR